MRGQGTPRCKPTPLIERATYAPRHNHENEKSTFESLISEPLRVYAGRTAGSRQPCVADDDNVCHDLSDHHADYVEAAWNLVERPASSICIYRDEQGFSASDDAVLAPIFPD